MWMLASGLAPFFVAHLIPTFPDVRTRLVGMIGRGPYAGLFSLVSLVSLVLVVWGYGAMQGLAHGAASWSWRSTRSHGTPGRHATGFARLVNGGVWSSASQWTRRNPRHHVVISYRII